jgi:ATP-dependent RNA helicase DeaD
VAGSSDRYRGVVESLASEFDVVDIALAAVGMADAEARGDEDTTELAPAILPNTWDRGRGGAGKRPRYGDDRAAGYARGPRPRPGDVPYRQGPMDQGPGVGPGFNQGMRPGPGMSQGPGTYQGAGMSQGTPPGARPRPTGAPPPFAGLEGPGQPGAQSDRMLPPGDPRGPRTTRPASAGPAAGPMPAGPRRGYRPSGWQDVEGRPIMRAPNAGSGGPGGVTRLFVGAGRAAGVRPGDLVGAITNEAGLRGGDIGAIQIADGFSLVEVPSDAADHVIRRLRGATIRGQLVTVRRERY